MPVAQLNHVTVRTDDLEGTRDFYHDMLGLTAGPRPPLGFPGYWLYAGENPLAHLVPKSHGTSEVGLRRIPAISIMSPSARRISAACHRPWRTLPARVASGCCCQNQQVPHCWLPGLRCERLRERGIKFREQQVPASLARQMFFEDPNKVMIELNFPSGSCR